MKIGVLEAMRSDTTVLSVCVHYDDFLSITLPTWKKHFDNIWVITTWGDRETQAVVNKHGARGFCTDVFYSRGAKFNKAAAIEEFFDYQEKKGWFLHLDSDIVLPDEIDIPEDLEIGYIYSVPRRNCPNASKYSPGESWECFRYERQNLLHKRDPSYVTPLGYFQLFNAEDPHLPKNGPWFGRNFSHAGRYDIQFFRHWGIPHKNPNWRTLKFDVLHLGEVGRNWSGRVTKRLDGKKAPFGRDVDALQRKIWADTLAKGGSPHDRLGK